MMLPHDAHDGASSRAYIAFMSFMAPEEFPFAPGPRAGAANSAS